MKIAWGQRAEQIIPSVEVVDMRRAIPRIPSSVLLQFVAGHVVYLLQPEEAPKRASKDWNGPIKCRFSPETSNH